MFRGTIDNINQRISQIEADTNPDKITVTCYGKLMAERDHLLTIRKMCQDYMEQNYLSTESMTKVMDEIRGGLSEIKQDLLQMNIHLLNIILEKAKPQFISKPWQSKG